MVIGPQGKRLRRLHDLSDDVWQDLDTTDYKIRKIPFIPTETEIDHLIAGCGRKTATLLQLLKETGIRIGEA